MKLKIINGLLIKIEEATSAEIRHLIIPEGVKIIDSNVFAIDRTHTHIHSISLPKTLKRIGTRAFAGQSKISCISFPSSIECIEPRAFYQAGKFDVTIDCVDESSEENPHNLIIKESAFSQSEITSFTINCPRGNVIFDECALEECENLSSFEVTAGNVLLNDNCFIYCPKLNRVKINIKDKELNISKRCFFKCKSLVEFDFTQLDKIPSYAFYGTGFTSVTLSKKTKYVGEGAFGSCINLKDVKFEKEAENVILYESAFQDNNNLEDFDFAPIAEIKSYCFANTAKLKQAILSKTHLHSFVFFQSGLKYADLSSVLSVNIGCFGRCLNLTTVICPKTAEISKQMFSKCIMLEKVFLSDGITSIGEQAFSYTGLQQINLPESLVHIEDRAFYKSKLNNIDFSECYSLQKIGKESFNGTDLKQVNLINCILSEGVDSTAFDADVDILLPYYSMV